MALNHYLTLGRSGLRVSPLCLGTMTFGLDWGWGADATTSQHIVDYYLDHGGNFIDTANIYTKGHSEKILGMTIGNSPRRRQKTVLATKFCGNLYTGDPNAGGANRKAILQQLENSLRRLQTDYIDLYWMHFPDRFTPIDETMRTLDDLVRAGKVRYIGFSDTPAWQCAQAQVTAAFRGWSPLIAVQVEYSLLERSVELEIIPMARELGMGVTPWSPLKGGVLTGRYDAQEHTPAPTQPTGRKGGRAEMAARHINERSLAVIEALRSLASPLGVTPAQVALAWLRSRPGVVSTIIGARTMEQLIDNIKSLNVSLTPEQVARLDEITRPTPIFPQSFLPGTCSVYQGGTTINGEACDPWPLAPRTDTERH